MHSVWCVCVCVVCVIWCDMCVVCMYVVYGVVCMCVVCCGMRNMVYVYGMYCAKYMRCVGMLYDVVCDTCVYRVWFVYVCGMYYVCSV